MFDLVTGYPVDVINWASGTSDISLTDARRLTLDLLLIGTEQEVRDMSRRTIAEAGRRGFVLAADCVIQGPLPDANLAAAREAVEGA